VRGLLLVSLSMLSLALGACGGESNEEKVVKAIETEDEIVEVVETALVKPIRRAARS
jgi:hypothetical protein